MDKPNRKHSVQMIVRLTPEQHEMVNSKYLAAQKEFQEKGISFSMQDFIRQAILQY